MTSSAIVRRHWSGTSGEAPARLANDEWLVTNGLGGYASGTLLGTATRRYHGLLVAALPAPLGRMMLLNHLAETVRLADGRELSLVDDGRAQLVSFSLEFGLPVWRFNVDGCVLEKRIFMPHRANTTHLMYSLAAGRTSLQVILRPGLHFRAHEAPVGVPDVGSYETHTTGSRLEITTNAGLSLKMQLRQHEGALVADGGTQRLEYPMEQQRGYRHCDQLWSPGYFQFDLAPEETATLSASAEPWDALTAMEPDESLHTEVERRRRLVVQADALAQHGVAAELVLAADQFIITPSTRVADEVWAHAVGEEARSIIAGYHWFTDWGRDTMISLEGLTLITGRATEAGYILRTFGHHVRDGLIPNLFPEGENTGLYHTADATLWYFHALDRYVQHTDDRETLRALLPTLRQIVARHVAGTHFGIGVDPADGLLRQGAEGYQLTWMDAKVDDWVVTPRRGKAVEINALWYNALRLLSGWLVDEGLQSAAAEITQLADRTRKSFNARFWCAERGWLYDVIDGPAPLDISLRPNQVLAISLPHAVLDERHWASVLEAVRRYLWTPYGLRTLAPFELDYKPQYFGDLYARDAAYHQGTAWAWLIGPYMDACLRLGQDCHEMLSTLNTSIAHELGTAGVGTVSEIFDAEPPYTPRGCISQAWSVAEMLRCCVKLQQQADCLAGNPRPQSDALVTPRDQ
jgi:predicted glycogen debranching enzyme